MKTTNLGCARAGCSLNRAGLLLGIRTPTHDTHASRDHVELQQLCHKLLRERREHLHNDTGRYVCVRPAAEPKELRDDVQRDATKPVVHHFRGSSDPAWLCQLNEDAGKRRW
jgi:hypothetical protein